MPFTPRQPARAAARRGLLLLLTVSVVSALAALMSGCNRPSPSPPDQADQAPVAETPEVRVVKPEKKDVRRRIERPGYNVEAYERTPLYAKLAGYVRKWNADLGDRVHQGDVLAELYIPEMAVELKEKEAAVRQADAEVLQAQATLRRAEAEQERAKSQYERLARVGRSGVLDKEQVDETRLGFETAQAAVAKARADVTVAEARVDVARAARDRVETLLQYTTVRAPYDGVITQRSVNTENFVQPADANKGASLFVVEKVDPMRVFVNVSELDAVWVRDGDAALVRAQSLPDQPFRGTVTRSSGTLHPQNRTLRTEIDLPNPDGKLMPGMYASVTIIAERKNVWALPPTAVVTQGEQTFCYRVENGKAVRTPVQVGMRGQELVEVAKKETKRAGPGQEAGWEAITGEETVVASEAASLVDGQAVRVASRNK